MEEHPECLQQIPLNYIASYIGLLHKHSVEYEKKPFFSGVVFNKLLI